MAIALIPQTTWYSGGALAAGGSLYVYQTGTTTLVTIYSDSGLTTPISNPITLDANGQAKFYVGSSVSLRLDSYTSSGAFIESLDPVFVLGTSASGYLSKGTTSTGAAYTVQASDVSTLFYAASGSGGYTYTIPQSALSGTIGYFGFSNPNNTGTVTLTFSGGATVKGWGILNNVTSITLPGNAANGPATIILFSDGSGNVDVVYATPDLQATPAFVPAPKGRLSLSSSAAVMTGDATAQGTIYYLPYIGQKIPIYNGSTWTMQDIGSSGISLTLNSTNMPASQVYDVYASLQNGTLTLSAMYWGGNTSRSVSAAGKSGTGNASITQKNGIWVNNAAITSSDSFNGTTGNAIPQNQGTYLGTFYTTANGQTGVALKPSAASGGSNNIIGLWNAYNRIKINALGRDSTSSWTYGTNAWRAANNSSSNRISWVDGLQQSPVSAYYSVAAANNSVGSQSNVGVSLDSSTSAPNISYDWNAFVANDSLTMISPEENFYPQLGFHFIQAMEIVVTNTNTFLGQGTFQSLIWKGEY